MTGSWFGCVSEAFIFFQAIQRGYSSVIGFRSKEEYHLSDGSV